MNTHGAHKHPVSHIGATGVVFFEWWWWIIRCDCVAVLKWQSVSLLPLRFRIQCLAFASNILNKNKISFFFFITNIFIYILYEKTNKMYEFLTLHTYFDCSRLKMCNHDHTNFALHPRTRNVWLQEEKRAPIDAIAMCFVFLSHFFFSIFSCCCFCSCSCMKIARERFWAKEKKH